MIPLKVIVRNECNEKIDERHTHSVDLLLDEVQLSRLSNIFKKEEVILR